MGTGGEAGVRGGVTWGLPLALALLIIGSFVYGMHLMRLSESLPAFERPARAEQLRMSLPNDPAAEKAWVDEWNTMWSPKWLTHDSGRAWVALSACLLVATVLLRLWDVQAVSHLQTPRPLLFAILAIGSYLSPVPIVILIVEEDFERELLPVWGDTLAIPTWGTAFLIILGLPLALTLTWLLAKRARRRASLWVWNRTRPLRSIVVTGGACILLFIPAHDLMVNLLYGSGYSVPLLFCFTYVTLAARALLVYPSRASAPEQNNARKTP